MKKEGKERKRIALWELERGIDFRRCCFAKGILLELIEAKRFGKPVSRDCRFQRKNVTYSQINNKMQARIGKVRKQNGTSRTRGRITELGDGLPLK